MKKLFFCIPTPLFCFFLFSGCGIGLNKSARQQFSELNDSVKESKEELQGLKTELEALNQNLAEIKAVATSPEALDQLKEVVAIMKRIAEALEALKNKTGTVMGGSNLSPEQLP